MVEIEKYVKVKIKLKDTFRPKILVRDRNW